MSIDPSVERAALVVDDALHDSRVLDVTVGGGRARLARFADGRIHQSTDESWLAARVVVDTNGRRGVAETTDISAAGLSRATDRASEIADASPAAPDALPPVHPEEDAPHVDDGASWDRQLHETGVAWLTDAAATALFMARPRSLRAAGFARVTDGAMTDYGDPGVLAFGNRLGLRRRHARTTIDAAVMFRDEDGNTGWASDAAGVRGAFDIEATCERALRRVQANRNPAALEVGRYRTILSPEAVAALLPFVTQTFSADAVARGTSLLSGHDGSPLAAELLSLHADPAALGAPSFDGEGVLSSPLTLLNTGRPQHLARDRRDQQRDGIPTNGYSPSLPSHHPARPRSLVLRGGNGTAEELEARHPNAIAVSRLWYNRLVDARAVRVTGLTRDGFFERERGVVTRALLNMRYNVSVFDMLRNVVDASAPVRVGDVLAPALVVDAFPFTAAASRV
ncbi:MAG: PmbA protein [Bradymonadia bacterium]|jgi:PmbA protein